MKQRHIARTLGVKLRELGRRKDHVRATRELRHRKLCCGGYAWRFPMPKYSKLYKEGERPMPNPPWDRIYNGVYLERAGWIQGDQSVEDGVYRVHSAAYRREMWRNIVESEALLTIEDMFRKEQCLLYCVTKFKEYL